MDNNGYKIAGNVVIPEDCGTVFGRQGNFSFQLF